MKEKVIGVLGGMGPEATLDFFKKIIQSTPAAQDQEHIRVIIDNNPKIPDRTEAILGKGKSPVPMMVQSGLSLERAGADFIVIPCISAHFFLDELRPQINLPILSVFDEAAISLTHEYPDIKVVGLLATQGTVQGGMFSKRMRESNLTTLVPEPDDQERVNGAIYRIKSSAAKELRKKDQQILSGVAQRLVEQGAQAVIAGCTEIPLVLKSKDVSVPLLDTLSILARAAVREAKGEASVGLP